VRLSDFSRGNNRPKQETKTMKAIQRIIMAGALVLALTTNVFAQNTLQFTGVSATSEKAIQLHWASNTNEIYQIQYANALATNTDSSTAWNVLYDDYPAHQGSNTFWLDTGNYNFSPVVPHPKNSSMRFYRVMLEGTNTSGDNPSVSITYPTNGTILSGNVMVAVSASSDRVIESWKRLLSMLTVKKCGRARMGAISSSIPVNGGTVSIRCLRWQNRFHISPEL
jgi:hypothetical protein